jgi:multidrug efflux system membrane fusion protein
MVIGKGLAAGEQVVTEGQMLLVDGARARVAK